ncbi:Frataxin, mitosomal [Nosema granulosis]|uniref:Frataxin, mitosomal n=1 Tax=Nosema granulosis TaxID=83296 RepID=A0A9P6KXD3_9MICR|nr:Frataxin, mitosomal [Nosema granulosis]
MINPTKFTKMISPTKFNKMISQAFSYISDKLEPFSTDISEDSSSLSISIQGIGEYLFNKQPASQQLWGSSPLSGPCRFDLVEGRWIHNKKKVDLEKYIEEEIA